MNYLIPSEYQLYGLDSTTEPALVGSASSLIDAHCRRATLGLVQYEERIRMMPDRNTVRLTYLPLAPVSCACDIAHYFGTRTLHHSTPRRMDIQRSAA